MKSLIIFSLVLSLFLSCPLLHAQSGELDCSSLKDCKLATIPFVDGDYVLIKDSIHVEYVDGGKYFIKSKLKWISECAYDATVIEVNWPEFNFPLGAVLHSEILKIENDTVYFELNVQDINLNTSYKLILNH